MSFKLKTCECGQGFKQYKSTDRFCSYECRKMYGKKANIKLKALNPISSKRQEQNVIYRKLKAEFMALPENKICPVTGKPTVDLHHKKGRSGSLFLDPKYWLAVSREGHQKIEENPMWAKEMGYSLDRLSK